jgi:hypothetical protein
MLANNLANNEREGAIHRLIMPISGPPVKRGALFERPILTLSDKFSGQRSNFNQIAMLRMDFRAIVSLPECFHAWF